MNTQPFTEIDEEDRRPHKRKSFVKGLIVGLGLSLGTLSALLFWGVV